MKESGTWGEPWADTFSRVGGRSISSIWFGFWDGPVLTMFTYIPGPLCTWQHARPSKKYVIAFNLYNLIQRVLFSPVVLNWGQCCPSGDVWQCGDVCDCHIWGRGWRAGNMLLASRGSRPGMQLNILPCTGQPPPHIGIAPRLRSSTLSSHERLKVVVSLGW